MEHFNYVDIHELKHIEKPEVNRRVRDSVSVGHHQRDLKENDLLPEEQESNTEKQSKATNHNLAFDDDGPPRDALQNLLKCFRNQPQHQHRHDHCCGHHERNRGWGVARGITTGNAIAALNEVVLVANLWWAAQWS